MSTESVESPNMRNLFLGERERVNLRVENFDEVNPGIENLQDANAHRSLRDVGVDEDERMNSFLARLKVREMEITRRAVRIVPDDDNNEVSSLRH